MQGQTFYALCRSRWGQRLLRAGLDSLKALRAIPSRSWPGDALQLDPPLVKNLAELWQRIHWSTGDGMMPADQLLAILRMAYTAPIHGDFVELGSWTGLTTCYLATVARTRGTGRVWAVDTFQGTREGGTQYRSIENYDGHTLPAFTDRIERAGVQELVTPLVGLTTEVAERYAGRPISFLLIDADHSYEGVRADFESWSPHVGPGGIIVFHDYALAEVARFVDQDIPGYKTVFIRPGLAAHNVFAVTKCVSTPITAPSPGSSVPNPKPESVGVVP